MYIHVEGAPTVPSTTLLEMPPEEQAQMRAILRRARYGYLLAFHILLLCAAAHVQGGVVRGRACCSVAPP